MKKGYQTLELDDVSAQFYFNTSSGEGETKYNTKIKKYTIHGLVLAPTNDDESNYAGVTVSGSTYNSTPTGLVFGADTVAQDSYLVNKSGSRVTNKAKLKDNNDAYYVVNNNGKVLKYFQSEDDYKSWLTYDSDKDKQISITTEMLKSATAKKLQEQVDKAIAAKKKSK